MSFAEPNCPLCHGSGLKAVVTQGDRVVGDDVTIIPPIFPVGTTVTYGATIYVQCDCYAFVPKKTW